MRQSSWVRIVNVSSVAGVMPQPTGPEYGASKAAINNLSLSLTKALGASGVTVNTVSPGMIHTPKLEIQLRQIATTKGWVANGASWGEIERLFLKVSQVPLGRMVALRRSRTPLSSCVASLPVTSPERICELMAALCQLYRAVLTLRRTLIPTGR
jgi:NAD(P)-dependent dehydrogenase (short-subunit alcohol dehydrogenase family)